MEENFTGALHVESEIISGQPSRLSHDSPRQPLKDRSFSELHPDIQAGQNAQIESSTDDGGFCDPPAPTALFFAHPIMLTFYDLPAKSEARVTLKEEMKVQWGRGDPRSRLVGVSLSAFPRGATLSLSRFILNSRELIVSAYQKCPEIRIRLYVNTLETMFGGLVDLPAAASLTIESSIDRTTLVERGSSSFALALR
jgi:hypothetical protein